MANDIFCDLLRSCQDTCYSCKLCFLFSSLTIRHYSADCICCCGFGGESKQHFCNICTAKLEVFTDPANGTHGPPWRNLEASGICSLCTQQGKFIDKSSSRIICLIILVIKSLEKFKITHCLTAQTPVYSQPYQKVLFILL